MPSSRDDADLVKVARLYFVDGLSQAEVADAVGTSRSNVSRMIAAARDRGIVSIRIHDPAGRDGELEDALARRFGIGEVRVAAFRPATDPPQAVGLLAAEWLLDTLRDGQIVALSWGRALQQFVHAVTADRPRAVEVVQLVGGLSPIERAATGQELVRELAARLGATYRYLHAPAILQSAAAREALESERSIHDALDAARSAHIAMVGVGTVGVGSSAFVVDAMHLRREETRQFTALSPVGDICARYFDIEGRPVPGPVDERVLGVTLAELHRIPTVTGVVSGAEKAPGLLGALRAGYLNVVICDAAVARAVLAHADTTPDRRSVPPTDVRPTQVRPLHVPSTHVPPTHSNEGEIA